MLYILAGLTGMCALICAAELLVRVADRTGIMDKLFGAFDLPEDNLAEKKSAPNAATSEGTKVIYIGDIIPQYAEVVKEEMR